ncbi:MAG: M15 family metallopeptidase [Ruminococcus sp.]|nr:M15 family metallopeptidase [Ruminococcus sp.]
MKKQRLISIILCVVLAIVFTGCGKEIATNNKAKTIADASSKAGKSIDYMALVNKTHALPDDWEENLETTHFTNSVGDDVEVEKKAYDAYLKLKADLEKEKIYVDLDSACRSVEDQERIMESFTKDFGADYAKKTVAKPGYSEHHTGLALDLYLIVDGKDIVENDEMIKYTDIWEKIHSKLADYGFILRYLDGKEHITGYGYEPWHIRYIDDTKVAKLINDKGLTFEGYLKTAIDKPVKIDLGKSEQLTKEDLNDSVVQIKCQFAAWDGFELKSITYAGDEASNDEAQANKLNPDGKYTQIALFKMNFRTSKNVDGTGLEANKDYKDYEWWLGKTIKDGWGVITPSLK